MRISIELTMYPLSKEYKQTIVSFVKKLRTYKELELETNGMSTQVFGEYDEVMSILSREIRTVFGGEDKVSTVMKILNDDLQGPIKF